MNSNIEIRKKITSEWFRFLQSQICTEFEEIERKKSNGRKVYSIKKIEQTQCYNITKAKNYS